MAIPSLPQQSLCIPRLPRNGDATPTQEHKKFLVAGRLGLSLDCSFERRFSPNRFMSQAWPLLELSEGFLALFAAAHLTNKFSNGSEEILCFKPGTEIHEEVFTKVGTYASRTESCNRCLETQMTARGRAVAHGMIIKYVRRIQGQFLTGILMRPEHSTEPRT